MSDYKDPFIWFLLILIAGLTLFFSIAYLIRL